jgi:hypothetical protein
MSRERVLGKGKCFSFHILVSVFFRDERIAFRDKRDDFDPQGVKVLRGKGELAVCVYRCQRLVLEHSSVKGKSRNKKTGQLFKKSRRKP